jgi:pantetheine-phosphate adenylyltransferase
METLCVYPGSFDPITLGHVDIIRRAALIFPRVVVAVLRNPNKLGCFSIEKRVEMIEKACTDIPGAQVDCFEGLLVDYMKEKHGTVVIRGLRAVSDFDSEFQMAQVNHQISPELETLFMMTSPQHGYISSSVVREVAAFGGDVSSLVPLSILQDIYQKFPRLKASEPT